MTDYTEIAEQLKQVHDKILQEQIDVYGTIPWWNKPLDDNFVNEQVNILNGVPKKPGIYEVFDGGMDGRFDNNIAYIKADSPYHARVQVAVLKENPEISTTGYFDARLIDREVLVRKLKNVNKQKELLENILK